MNPLLRSVPEPSPEAGALLLSPECLEDWASGVLRNRERLIRSAFLGLGVGAMRSELGIASDGPVVVSGHQPVLLHPGLYAKPLAASAVAARVGGTALHKVTDTDVPREWPFRYPGPSGPERLNPFFEDSLQDVPYADQPVPSEAGLSAILDRCERHASESLRGILRSWRSALMRARERARHWVDFHIATLDLLDEAAGATRPRLVSSTVFSGTAFRRYAAAWFRSLEALGEAYNRALDTYRRELGLGNPAEPSPNLRVDGDWREAPFWIARPGVPRSALWLKRTGPVEAVLRTSDGDMAGVARWPSGILEVEGGFRIWPKALPQSLFVRLFVGDFFVHGTGGGRYERVNDLFFREVFAEEPPHYGVASATILLEGVERAQVRETLDRLDRALQWRRLLRQNPEYLLTRSAEMEKDLPIHMAAILRNKANEPEIRSRLAEKTSCLERLKDPETRGPAGRAIREINRLLQEILEPLWGPDFDVLLGQREAARLLLESLEWREYPFFFHDPRAFRELASKMGGR